MGCLLDLLQGIGIVEDILTVDRGMGRALLMCRLPERKKMMQDRADYLDKLNAGAEVIALQRLA